MLGDPCMEMPVLKKKKEKGIKMCVTISFFNLQSGVLRASFIEFDKAWNLKAIRKERLGKASKQEFSLF